MTFEESLILERYKLVTERQKYFTDFARDTFNSYTTIFAAFAAGAVTLVSLKKQLEIDAPVVTALLQTIAVLLTLAAALSIAQIEFCLKRWYGFRNAECEINPQVPKPETWAGVFEGMYGLGIAASVGVAWWGVKYFQAILDKL